MLFDIVKRSTWLQDIAVRVHAAIHPSIEHNLAKITMIKKALFHCELESIAGSYMEFGVFEGTSLLAATLIHRKLQSKIPRTFFGFDAFDGFKYFDNADQHPFFREGDFKSSYEKVVRRFRRFDNVKLIKGYFEESLKDHTPADICENAQGCAICFIDCDLMSPALCALRFVRPALQKGTIIILDDYWAYKGDPNAGICGAIATFLDENPNVKLRPYYDYGHGGASFVVWNV